jgi:hypothetical protein
LEFSIKSDLPPYSWETHESDPLHHSSLVWLYHHRPEKLIRRNNGRWSPCHWEIFSLRSDRDPAVSGARWNHWNMSGMDFKRSQWMNCETMRWEISSFQELNEELWHEMNQDQNFSQK